MNTIALRSLFMALLLTLVAGCASSSANSVRSGTAKAVTATTELGIPDSTSAAGAYTGASEYRVGAQDLVEISVFQVPELNRTVRINAGLGLREGILQPAGDV